VPLGDLTSLEKHVCEMLTHMHNWWNLVELTHLHKVWSGEEKEVTGCDQTLWGPVTPGKSDQWLNLGTTKSKWHNWTLALRRDRMSLCHYSWVGNVHDRTLGESGHHWPDAFGREKCSLNLFGSWLDTMSWRVWSLNWWVRSLDVSARVGAVGRLKGPSMARGGE
jgi:hypothetical protein